MKLKILRLDVESYFDSKAGYSLKSKTMNMSEYIRDKRFRAHGLSAGFEGEPIKWISHADIPRYLKSVPWAETALLCWNTPFDGLVLEHHYGYIPAFYLDGMRMAQILYPRTIRLGLDAVSKMHGIGAKISGALDEADGVRFLSPTQDKKMGQYAINDSKIMWKNWEIMAEHIPTDELRLIDLTTLLFCAPVAKLNKPLVRKEIQRLEVMRAQMFERIRKQHNLPDILSVTKMLGSSIKMAAALEKLDRTPPMKRNKNGDRIFAFAKTDPGLQALKLDPDQRVRDLVEARLEVKGGSTKLIRAKRFLAAAEPALPIGLDYGKPRTIRWSGTNKMNPQNLDREGFLRYAIEAPPGYKMNVVDSSQIEDRMNCFLSGQNDVLNAYRTGGDPYRMMAARIYNKDPADITKAERFVGKVARLQLGYQSGKQTFHTSLISGALGPPIEISRDESDMAHNAYRLANNKIIEFWRHLKEKIPEMMKPDFEETYEVNGEPIFDFAYDEVRLPSGLSMHYLDLRYEYDEHEDRSKITYQSSPNGRSVLYEGKFCENLNQALAKIVVANQILDVAERYRVVSTTHDEVWYLSHWREGLKPLKYGLECFSRSRGWYADIPLGAEGGQAQTYGDAKKGEMTLKNFR